MPRIHAEHQIFMVDTFAKVDLFHWKTILVLLWRLKGTHCNVFMLTQERATSPSFGSHTISTNQEWKGSIFHQPKMDFANDTAHSGRYQDGTSRVNFASRSSLESESRISQQFIFECSSVEAISKSQDNSTWRINKVHRILRKFGFSNWFHKPLILKLISGKFDPTHVSMWWAISDSVRTDHPGTFKQIWKIERRILPEIP
jgi:hypothetical protein